MLLGCFSRDGVGPLVQIEGIMKSPLYCDILEQHMLPHAHNKMADDWLFQQDNDPKHQSKLAKNWMVDHSVSKIVWPSQSPDLNPIEHLWEELDRKIRTRTFTKTNELMKALSEEWQNISIDVLTRLVDSMPRRCEAVIKAKGYATITRKNMSE